MVFLNTIKRKVWFCASVGILGFLVTTVSTYYASNRLISNLERLRDVLFPLSILGEDARNLFALQTSYYEYQKSRFHHGG